LATALIAVFREAPKDVHYTLAEFSESSWLDSYSWLDASGLALYLLQRVKSLRVEEAIPVTVLRRLEQNAADNRERTASMLAEWVKINKVFKDAGLTYVNCKGFTLVPDACSDATFRSQFDLDFTLLRSDVSRCEEVLRSQGYWLSGVGDNVREYKAGSRQLPRMQDLYSPNSQHCLEIHLIDSTTQDEDSYDGKLLRVQQRNLFGLTFPVFSDSDRFVGQALHLFKHLQGEWTRMSWILEYASFVKFHSFNNILWDEISKISSTNSEVRIAVGAATLIADRIFGNVAVPPILTRTVEDLPDPVRLWIERYGEKAVMSRFPGTKLYLLLQNALDRGDASTRRTIRRKLLPVHRPQRVISSFPGEPWSQCIRNYITQLRYNCFRLWFHLINGLSYLLEAQLWKRYIARQQC
jgi:hypothetical protein